MNAEIDTDGLLIDGRRVSWSDVEEVYAYKDDLFAFDEIRLGFRIADNGASWTVSESWPGYPELLAALPLRFPGIRTDWFSEVAFPAFEAKRTTLWGRALPG